ncbi:MAG: hypothetical protein LAO76_11675 [Acidobacteriia bacterium]|nr:hypothetical protein [Terriglobia bacterium]
MKFRVPWTESAFNPIHNFAINIARTWIHGSTDLVEVLFTTPLRDFIVIILPVPEASLPRKSHRVICTLQWRTKAANINIHSWSMVCMRWDRMENNPPAEWPKEGSANLIVKLTLRAGCNACLIGLCFRQVRALHQRSTQESERYSFQY